MTSTLMLSMTCSADGIDADALDADVIDEDVIDEDVETSRSMTSPRSARKTKLTGP